MSDQLTSNPQAQQSSSELYPAIETRGLRKSYPGRVALAELNTSFRPGEFTALLGASGAGKTTFLRCLAGLTNPDQGTVRVNGRDICDMNRKQKRSVAIVFQQYNLVPRISALDNVLAGRLGHVSVWRGLAKRFKREDQLLALACLSRVGMLQHAEQRADTLSGGQQQRVAIARVLAQEPQVILADEPVASLDPIAAADILNLLRDICTVDKVCVICSLHQIEFARTHADRIIALMGGRLVFDQSTSVLNGSTIRRIYEAEKHSATAREQDNHSPINGE